MKLAEERHIAADPATVWAAVLNPQVLQACVPGCESLTGSPSDGFEALVVQKEGPVKARFTGTVTLSEMVEAVRKHLHPIATELVLEFDHRRIVPMIPVFA